MDFLKNLFTSNKEQTSALNSFQSSYMGGSKPVKTQTNSTPMLPTSKDLMGSSLFGSSYNKPYTPPNQTPFVPKVDNTIKASQMNTGTESFAFNQPNTEVSNLAATNAEYGKVEAPKSPRESMMGKYSELQEMLGTQGDFQAEVEKEQQFEQKAQLVADLNARYDRISKQYDDQIRDIDKTFNTPQQYNAQVEEISRKKNERLADIAIQQQAALGNLSVAENIIERKVNAKFEPIKAQIQATKDWFSLYSDDLTKSEQIQLQSMISQQEALFESDLKSSIDSEKNTLLRNQAETFIPQIQSGMSIKDVPKEYQQALVELMNERGIVDGETQTKITNDIQLAGKLFDLINDPALGASVGPASRFLPSWKTITGATGDFKKSFEQIRDNLTLGNLGLMSGVLSETDIKILSNAATKLDMALTDEEFIKEAKNLHSLYVSKILEKPFVDSDTKRTVLGEKILLENPKISESQLESEIEMLMKVYTPQAFNSAGNASASTLANAIKTVESGGNYQARGPVVTSGQYKGERALGAYQIMPGNLASWSKEALGREVAEQEFLSNPKIQDQIALSRFSKLLSQGYSPEDASAIWFSGRPLSGNTSKDVTGTNTQTYVSRVIKNLRA